MASWWLDRCACDAGVVHTGAHLRTASVDDLSRPNPACVCVYFDVYIRINLLADRNIYIGVYIGVYDSVGFRQLFARAPAAKARVQVRGVVVALVPVLVVVLVLAVVLPPALEIVPEPLITRICLIVRRVLSAVVKVTSIVVRWPGLS